jgi:arylformamidase
MSFAARCAASPTTSRNEIMDYDRAYANGPFIPGGDAYPGRWLSDAAAFRSALGERARLDIPYGAGARQKLDLFLPEARPAGLLVFLHGGYWLRFGRDSWSHLARGALARGWAAAIPSYTLAPESRIAGMRAECVRAVEVAAGLVEGPVVLTGHSAGGQLSARIACDDVALAAPLRRVVPLSPLADLEPIALTAMNRDLLLDEAEIAQESPARHTKRADVEAHVWVGADERPAFLYHARLLAEAWACPWTPEMNRHHYDVIEGYRDPASPLLAACLG